MCFVSPTIPRLSDAVWLKIERWIFVSGSNILSRKLLYEDEDLQLYSTFKVVITEAATKMSQSPKQTVDHVRTTY